MFDEDIPQSTRKTSNVHDNAYKHKPNKRNSKFMYFMIMAVTENFGVKSLVMTREIIHEIFTQFEMNYKLLRR